MRLSFRHQGHLRRCRSGKRRTVHGSEFSAHTLAGSRPKARRPRKTLAFPAVADDVPVARSPRRPGGFCNRSLQLEKKIVSAAAGSVEAVNRSLEDWRDCRRSDARIDPLEEGVLRRSGRARSEASRRGVQDHLAIGECSPEARQRASHRICQYRRSWPERPGPLRALRAIAKLAHRALLRFVDRTDIVC